MEIIVRTSRRWDRMHVVIVGRIFLGLVTTSMEGMP